MLSRFDAFSTMALTAYVLFLLIVVIGRAVMHYQKTGDCGLRRITAHSSTHSKIASALLMISFAATFSLATLDAFGLVESHLQLGGLGSVLGILFCAVGITVAALSQHQMGDTWRIGVDESERTELVTHGLYSYARNPIYSGVMLFGLGLLILVPHALMLLGLFLGYLCIELQVRYVEEPHLRHVHGAAYQYYSRNVRRYFPNLLRLAKRS